MISSGGRSGDGSVNRAPGNQRLSSSRSVVRIWLNPTPRRRRVSAKDGRSRPLQEHSPHRAATLAGALAGGWQLALPLGGALPAACWDRTIRDGKNCANYSTAERFDETKTSASRASSVSCSVSGRRRAVDARAARVPPRVVVPRASAKRPQRVGERLPPLREHRPDHRLERALVPQRDRRAAEREPDDRRVHLRRRPERAGRQRQEPRTSAWSWTKIESGRSPSCPGDASIRSATSRWTISVASCSAAASRRAREQLQAGSATDDVVGQVAGDAERTASAASEREIEVEEVLLRRA